MPGSNNPDGLFACASIRTPNGTRRHAMADGIHCTGIRGTAAYH